MTTLTLNRVWINLLPTGEAVSAPSNDRTRSYETKGEVRTYGGGRQRAILSEGTAVTFTFSLRLLSWAQVQTLIGWIGRTVQVRDNRGTRYFAVFTAVIPVEIPKNPTKWDAQLSLREVTYTEGV